MEKHQEIERSIIKKYRKEIWKRFISSVNTYKMVNEGDKIAVCISGGKDSMLLAKCLQELQKHGIHHFELEFIVMDPGYAPANRQRIIDNAALLNIPITIFESDIFDVVSKADRSPCYLCAKMRRGFLYSRAQALGCNKIALGHHFDDVIETILMSMLYGAEIKTMMPKLHSTNFAGMELVRPLYMVREADVIAWTRYNSLEFIQCACRFTEQAAQTDSGVKSARLEMKNLVKTLRQTNPNVDISIFNSVQDVNLKTIIGYHDGVHAHSFLDDYDTHTSPDDED